MIPHGLIAAASVADQVFKIKFDLDKKALINSNEEMEYIIKIVISLKESCLLIKCASKTIEIEAKEQKGGFLGAVLSTWPVSR